MPGSGTMPDFECILGRARVGDDDALAELLERFGPATRGELKLAARWQGEIDLDDVMQITYVDAFLRIGSCVAQHEATFQAWLVQIARHNLLDAIRGLEADKRPPVTRRITSGSNGDSYVQLCELLGGSTSTPSRTVSREELRTHIDAAIQRLPADYAQVIRLMDLEGHSGVETAARMGRSRAAVHMLAGRARERLRELLGSATRFF
ncbi:MAG: sigma-70 family RNA polymerase sigma factor [Phycisphaerales bacterium]|nr:sigma-70 family RNA polymerase sigma factor [Phycisphaerales bacterium]